jgi:hypothetical protein
MSDLLENENICNRYVYTYNPSSPQIVLNMLCEYYNNVFYLGARDGTQGFVHVKKYSTTEIHLQPHHPFIECHELR